MLILASSSSLKKGVTKLSKIVVVYDSKFGNTRQVAEEITASINESTAVDVILNGVKEINFDNVITADAILIGSPNHLGRATKSIRNFIDELGKINLNRIPLAVFDTCFSRECHKVTKKMEKQITKKVPSLKLITPGLSIKVKGAKGPILVDELPKCREFGVRFGKKVEG
jgi:menaquinone-dependent protoporphyrinogen IX oxidase